MFINFNKRKYLLAQNRSAISEEKWANYLYNTYPEWWESQYKDIWFFNIIYYPICSYSTNAIIYNLKSSRYSTMENILNNFNSFIINQHKTIKLCFGEDIYSLLKYYLPSIISFDKNYFYVHQHKINVYSNSYYFTRCKIPNDKILNHVMVDISGNTSNIINLRLRAKMFSQNSRIFEKKLDYD